MPVETSENNHWNYGIEWRISGSIKYPKFFQQEVVQNIARSYWVHSFATESI
jgi:type II secretory pathway component GspD/PulD (secretin)